MVVGFSFEASGFDVDPDTGVLGQEDSVIEGRASPMRINGHCKECEIRANALRVAARTLLAPPSTFILTPVRLTKNLYLAGRVTRPIINACFAKIMDRNGNPGAIGLKLKRVMGSIKNRPFFTASQSLVGVCPKFRKMNDPEKLNAWTWFWLALANREDGGKYNCSPATRHHTRPRPGIGLWGMELYGRHRNWRGPECRGDISKVDKQVSCAISIMRDTQLMSGDRSVMSRNSYWATINNRSIVKDMRGYAPCH